MNYLEEKFSLRERVAIVTGSARGNGFAIAQALAQAGARVLAVDILADELQKAVDTLKQDNLLVTPLAGDLTDPAFRSHVISYADTTLGRLDVLVNNAGISLPHSGGAYPEDKWNKTYQLNLFVPFNLIQLATPVMSRRNRGSIINITSLNAELAFPDNPAYIAFKGALKQLSKSFALDLGRLGIRVNNIGPGYFHTNMTQGSYNNPIKRAQYADNTMLGRWGEPEDLAGAAIFLASEASSYVTGQDIYVDGGWLAKGL